MPAKIECAEQRYREAFERLKSNRPERLPLGSHISQNNVAKEAGNVPSALKLSRFPGLIAEIQAAIVTSEAETLALSQKKARARNEHEDLKSQLKRLTAERDHAQSDLLNAHQKLLELFQETVLLRTRLDDLSPPPITLSKVSGDSH